MAKIIIMMINSIIKIINIQMFIIIKIKQMRIIL